MLRAIGLRTGDDERLAAQAGEESATGTPSAADHHMDSDWDAFDSFANFSLHGTSGRPEQRGKRIMQRVGLGSSGQPGFFSNLFGGGSPKARASDYELVRTQLDGLSAISATADDDDDDLLF